MESLEAFRRLYYRDISPNLAVRRICPNVFELVPIPGTLRHRFPVNIKQLEAETGRTLVKYDDLC
jgi:hypothetical protein